jgi:hypothetical protein
VISKWIGKGVLLLACLAGLPMGSAYAQSVSAPTQMVVVDDTQYNLVSSFASAVSVSGFDPVAVRVEVPQGSLRITTTTGLTAPPSASSSDWAGASSIYFEGALVDVNAALASLEIRGSGQTISLAAQQAAIAQAETDLKAGLDNHLKHKLASQLKGVTRSQSNQFAMHQAWKNKQGQVAEFLKPQFYLHSEDDNSHLDTEAKLKLAFQNGEGYLWTMQAHTSSKRLKNGMAEAHLSTRFAFDRDLDEDIAQRLNFGFETTKERGGNDFSLRTRTNSILSGYGFSQRFSETLYFNLYLEGWYSTIQTKYDRDTASGEASLKMLGASASAQLQGRYQISDMVRLELMAGFSKAKDVIQNKNIHLNVPLTQSLSQILISEPESTRWSIEPTFHFVLLPDKNKLLREMDVTPKSSCENMSSTKSAQVCAGGFRAEYQIKTPDDVKKSYFYFDYENLSNGPVHEYGLALNAQF